MDSKVPVAGVPLMRTLAPGEAHNALAATVTMYASILADYERTAQVFRAENAHLLKEIGDLRDEIVKLKGGLR